MEMLNFVKWIIYSFIASTEFVLQLQILLNGEIHNPLIKKTIAKVKKNIYLLYTSALIKNDKNLISYIYI